MALPITIKTASRNRVWRRKFSLKVWNIKILLNVIVSFILAEKEKVRVVALKVLETVSLEK